jgi:hypothetical protein
MRQNRYVFFIFATFSLLLCACNSADVAVNRPAQKSVSKTNSNISVNKIEESDKPLNKDFRANLPEDFQIPDDAVGKRLLKEYGAVFVAKGKIVVPQKVIFKDAADVSGWQADIAVLTETVGGVEIQLQAAAMIALKEAVEEAKAHNKQITPRGADAARRSYEDTEKLWASRVGPGLVHWRSNGRITAETADRIRALTPFEQVPEIFKLEAEGIYFSKDLSKSIIYSVAPPGSSQHLSMLALDVSEFGDAEVREVLARHGWFRTVISDLPHFTYLGVNERDLPGAGLKKAEKDGQIFWVPN